MNEIITALLPIVVTTIVIPVIIWIGALAVKWINIEYQKLPLNVQKIVKGFASQFVPAVEQVAAQNGWSSNTKYQKAFEGIAKELQANGYAVSEEMIQANIEAAVLALKQAYASGEKLDVLPGEK